MKLCEMRPHQCATARKEAWPVFLPAGTIEYHGEHLPLGVDTIAVEHALAEVEKRIPCVIAPTIWYGPSSFAVAGPERGTIDVDVDRFEKHVMDVLDGLLQNGFRRIIVVIHHQFEMGRFMPEALAFKKAASMLTFKAVEKERGRGWWGSADMGRYYEELETSANPFNWIQVVPLMNPDIQRRMGYDHAGKLETSLMLAAIPTVVEMGRLAGDNLWFTKDAAKASAEHGAKTFLAIVDSLIELAKSGDSA
jgi:creatinine amidohydrolase/Fe(II)-dependent formamide hydrolase-like protein